MKISIVSAYFNRRDLLINTLNTIKKTSFNNLEYIIVDDCSEEEHRVEDLTKEFEFIKVIRLEKQNKWYVNPCIPFNVGFKYVTGDFVIIQNPECLHVGDILSYVSNNLTDDNYLTFSCYSADLETTNNFSKYELSKEQILNHVKFVNSTVFYEGQSGWYNHPTYRPKAYHFTNAITKNNLDKLGGFDERYANGIGFDDDEFLRRIKKMNLKINYCTDPFVIHQNHYKSSNSYKLQNAAELCEINRSLFYSEK